MTAGQVAVAVGVVGVVAASAGFSARWTADDPGWYASLPRPSWQPPDVVLALWLTVATSLAVGYWRLVPPAGAAGS